MAEVAFTKRKLRILADTRIAKLWWKGCFDTHQKRWWNTELVMLLLGHSLLLNVSHSSRKKEYRSCLNKTQPKEREKSFLLWIENSCFTYLCKVSNKPINFTFVVYKLFRYWSPHYWNSAQKIEAWPPLGERFQPRGNLRPPGTPGTWF